jgi:hypothetical protein
MLKTDTDHYLDTEGYALDSPNDTLYSMTGILRKMQAIADRYVLIGELRGELMDITENADEELQAIYNFSVKQEDENPFTDTRAWYDLINNCNFFIRRADTTATAAGQKVMVKELAAVQTIRAWTYMQLLLNYGQAAYYEDPILTVQDMERIGQNPALRITALTDLLDREKARLLEAQEVQRTLGNPNYEGLTYAKWAFIPATLVLGDLYLFTGNYTAAATQYHDYLYTHRLYTYERFNRWMNAGFSGSGSYYNNADFISLIYTTTENETGSYLMGWCYPTQWSNHIGVNCTYQLNPSPASMAIWDRQDYAYLPSDATPQDEPVYTTGDLRGTPKLSDGGDNTYTESSMPPYDAGHLSWSYSFFTTSESDSIPFISKYGGRDGKNMTNVSYLYRAGGVYLRYAEALNRMGKPTLAFAILKYGVTNTIFTDSAKVNPGEVDPLPSYCNFPEAIFPLSSQPGFHSRGSGDSDRNAFYIIPAGVDTVRFVDERICDEMAMETAFEGNRFHDLMRFARYYGNEFLATRVANRRNVEDAALKARLLDERNWYLPHP